MRAYRTVAIATGIVSFMLFCERQPACASTPVNGTVSFRIKVPRPAAPSGAMGIRRVRPQYISFSTKSFGIFTDGANPVVANLNAITFSATVSFKTTVGEHTFTVAAYDRPGGRGNVLSSGTTAPIFVQARGVATIYLTLDGVVSSVVLGLAQIQATVGSSALIDLSVQAQDAGGYAMFSGTTFAQTFTLTSSDPLNGALSQTTVGGVPSYGNDAVRVRVAYSGAREDTITFSARGGGVKSVVPAILAPFPRPLSGEQLIITGEDDSNAAFSTRNPGQLLTTFGVPPLLENDEQRYGAAAIDAAARLVYVADYTAPNGPLIDVFQTSGTYAMLDSFSPRINPTGALAVDSVNETLYATGNSNTDIAILSTARGHASLGTIHGSINGAGLAVDAQARRLYAAGCGWYDFRCGNHDLQVYSTVPPYPELGYVNDVNDGGYASVTLDPIAGRLYLVESSLPNYLDVYRTSDLRLVARFGPLDIGRAKECGIAVDPADQRLYVGHRNSVTAYDAVSGALLRSFPSNSGCRIAVAPYLP
jgi:hypothetical protein